jgi:hypothetical protein
MRKSQVMKVGIKRRLVTTGLLVLLAAVVIVAVNVYNSHTPSCVTLTKNCMALIGLDLGNYRPIFGSLPPRVMRNARGEEAASWRYALQRITGLARENTREWINPTEGNADWRSDSFSTWRNFPYTSFSPMHDSVTTAFVAIAGPDTFFECQAPADPDLIVMIEKTDSGLNWMQPGDFDYLAAPIADETPAVNIVPGCSPKGFCVMFADWRVGWLDKTTPYGVLRKFFTNAEAAKHDRWELLGKYYLDGQRRPVEADP